MTIRRPLGLRAGFHAHLSQSEVPGLVHAGDQHAPPSWFIDEHSHRAWEFYLQLGGPQTHWRVAGMEHVVPPRGLLAVPPDTPHSMAESAPGSYHFYFAAFDTDQLLADDPELVALWRAAGPFSVRDAVDLVVPFETFLREVTTGQALRVQGLRHAAIHLLVEATRLLSPGIRRHNLAEHPAVAEARRLLDGDPARNNSVADLAAQVHLSPAYLTELFTAQVGESPARYRQRARLRRAEVLLAETDLSITAIAADLGFSSPQHLATTFGQHTGSTPRAFRRARRAEGR